MKTKYSKLYALNRVGWFLNIGKSTVLRDQSVYLWTTVTKLSKCSDCPACLNLPQQSIKTYIYELVKFLDAIRPLVQMFMDTCFNKLLDDFGHSELQTSHETHAAYIIQQAVAACIEQTFDSDDKSYYFFPTILQMMWKITILL